MKMFKKRKVVIPGRRLSSSEKDKVTKVPSSFRRGRTISNSLTTQHISSSDIPDGSHRLHIHHLSIKRRKLSVILAMILPIIFIIWILLTNFTAVVEIDITDTKITKTIKDDYYIESIEKYLVANPLTRLSFLMDDSALTNYVMSELPEVVSVSRYGNSSMFGVTSYIIDFRSPVAGWKIGEDQYYVDSKGVSFKENYYGSPQVQIVDNSGISPQAGIAIASNRFLSFVGKVVSLSESSGYPISKAVLPRNTTRELDIYPVGLDETYIKLSIDRSVGEQIEDMTRSLQYFKDKNQVLDYLDVRVSGKAFYK